MEVSDSSGPEVESNVRTGARNPSLCGFSLLSRPPAIAVTTSQFTANPVVLARSGRDRGETVGLED